MCVSPMRSVRISLGEAVNTVNVVNAVFFTQSSVLTPQSSHHGSPALLRSCTIAALVFLVCLALIGTPKSVCAGEQPHWLKKDTIERLFPQVAAYTATLSGKPSAMPVYTAGRPI